MVAYFRAGRKASVVQLLDPGNVGERQRPAELQVQDVPLKRVDHDAAVGVVPEVEQPPQKPLPLGERDLGGSAAEERPADRLRGRLRGLLPDRQDGCDVFAADQAVYAAPLGRILIVVQKIRILREKINAVYAAARDPSIYAL